MAAHDNAQMRLKNNIDPAGHEIGDEIWHTTLREAIHAEAEKSAHHFPPTVIRRLGQQQLVDLIAEDMAVWLHTIGDTYTAIDGVIYTLAEAPHRTGGRRLRSCDARRARRRRSDVSADTRLGAPHRDHPLERWDHQRSGPLVPRRTAHRRG